jgi:hypothetical protein
VEEATGSPLSSAASSFSAALDGAETALRVLVAVTGDPGERAAVPAVVLADAVAGIARLRTLAEAALVFAVGEVDARGGVPGVTSTASWLRGQARCTARAASSTVRLARALQRGAPVTRAALAAGDVTASSAGVVTDAVAALPASLDGRTVAAAETSLVDAARALDPGALVVVGRRVRALLDPDGAEAEGERAEAARRLTAATTLDGCVHLQGLLDPVGGAAVLAALDPLTAPHPAADGSPDPRTPDQRRADALVALARTALDGGRLPATPLGRPHLLLTADITTLVEQPGASGANGPSGPPGADGSGPGAGPGGGDPGAAPPTGGADPGDAPPPGSTAAVRAALAAALGRDLPAPAELTGVGPITAAAARTLACDATVTAVLTAGRRVLDVGRTRRLVTPALARALTVRDGGACAVPGCGRPQSWCDAHHLRAWSAGGATALDNLVLLCRSHHTAQHAGTSPWRITPPPEPGAPPRFTRQDTGRDAARPPPHERAG